MDDRYEAFSMADPLFYDAMHSERTAGASFAVAHRDLAEGWTRYEQDDWFVFHAEDAPPTPAQGWKIHASASLDAGLLTPTAGFVAIDGEAVDVLPRSLLPELRVLIPQKAYVFTGTVRENLTYLRPDAGAADVNRAVEVVGATVLVTRLGGYDAVIRPGNLSAGERQLLALARAYLSPAPVFVNARDR